MTKDPRKRLGCGDHGEKNIKTHSFFSNMQWALLEQRKVKPPFIPTVVWHSFIFIKLSKICKFKLFFICSSKGIFYVIQFQDI